MSSNRSDAIESAAWALAVIVAIAAVLAVVLTMQHTTHESHLHDLKYAHAEMLKCISSDRSAAECRVIVYGSW